MFCLSWLTFPARAADITDLICNTAGALVGYGLYRPWKKHLHAWM